jgi:hypothetical protein
MILDGLVGGHNREPRGGALRAILTAAWHLPAGCLSGLAWASRLLGRSGTAT